MNRKKILKHTGSTHPALKKILLALLFISAIGGYAGNAYLLSRSGPDIQSVVTKTLQSAAPNQTASEDPSLLDSLLPKRMRRPVGETFTDVRDLFRTAGDEKGETISFTFQGTLAGTDGAIAMINGKQVAVGADFQGVHVTSISNRVLILEYRGQTKKLVVGETVSVQLD
jgi:hypothetical protein